MKIKQCFLKSPHIKFRCWGTTQKKAYHIQNKAKKFEIKKTFITISALTHFSSHWVNQRTCSISNTKYPLLSRSIRIRNTCCTLSQIRNCTVNSEHHCSKGSPIKRKGTSHHFSNWRLCRAQFRETRKRCRHQWLTADSNVGGQSEIETTIMSQLEESNSEKTPQNVWS